MTSLMTFCFGSVIQVMKHLKYHHFSHLDSREKQLSFSWTSVFNVSLWMLL